MVDEAINHGADERDIPDGFVPGLDGYPAPDEGGLASPIFKPSLRFKLSS